MRGTSSNFLETFANDYISRGFSLTLLWFRPLLKISYYVCRLAFLFRLVILNDTLSTTFSRSNDVFIIIPLLGILNLHLFVSLLWIKVIIVFFFLFFGDFIFLGINDRVLLLANSKKLGRLLFTFVITISSELCALKGLLNLIKGQVLRSLLHMNVFQILKVVFARILAESVVGRTRD